MSTKITRKATFAALLTALALATLLILGGGYAFSAFAAEGDVTTEPSVTPFTITEVKSLGKDAEVAKAYLIFSEAPETAASGLLEKDAYKNLIVVNEKTPLEEIEGATLQYAQFNFGTKKKPDNRYAMEIAIPKTALSWTTISATSYQFKITHINRIDIKAGFGLPEEEGISATNKIAEDVVLYSGRDDFMLGVTDPNANAVEGAIDKVSIDDIGGNHRVHIKFKTADGAGYVFDDTLLMEKALHGAPATFNGDAATADKPATVNYKNIPDETRLNMTPFNYATATGLRYYLGRYITINGKPLAEVVTAPVHAAIQAGLSDADMLAFAKAIKAYDKNQITIDKDSVYIDLWMTNHYTYTPASAEGEDPKDPIDITWDVPDPDGTLEIKLLPGFTGRKMKCTQGSVATYDGKWTVDDTAMPDLKELKVTRVSAPENIDGDFKNFKIGFEFNASDAFTGDKTYYTAGYEWMKNTDLGHQRFTDEDLFNAGQYRMLETAGDKVIIGGKFGEDTEFKTRSIHQMLAEATAFNAGTYGIIGKDNAVTLHMAPNDIRIVIGGYTSAAQDGKHIFFVNDAFQNFTLTFKAGFRTPGGYEIKQDQNFIYDPDSVRWYEGTTLNDIYAAQAESVIEEIDELPAADALTLSDKARVEAARQSYEDIAAEAQALVTNYDKLTAAEAKIAALENEPSKPDPAPDDDKKGDDDQKGDGKKGCGSDLGGVASMGGVLLLAAAIAMSVRRRKEVK